MADGPDYQAEFEAALKAAQQPQPAPVVGGLTPPAPGLPDHQAELAAALAAPPTVSPEPFGPPAPAAPYDFLQAGVHGFTGGLIDPARAGIIAGTNYLTGRTPGFNYPEAAAQVQRGREAYETAHPYANLGANLAGGIVNPINVLGGRAIAQAPSLLEKVGLSGGIGTLTGAAQGAAENTTSVDDMLRGARIGGEWGGAIGTAFPIAGAAAGAAFPKLSPEIQALRNIGVQPTPGTIGGVPGAVETLFSHIPIAGIPVKAARGAVRGELDAAQTAARDQLQTTLTNQGPDFVRGAINEPLAKIGETVSPTAVTGHEMVQDLKGKLKTAYDNAVPTAGGVFDGDADTAVKDALANAKLNLSGRELEDFNKFVQDRIIGKVGTSGTLSGPEFQTIDQALGDKAHRFFKSTDPYHKEAAEAYDDLQDKMRAWLERVSPTNSTDLQNANLAFRTAKPILNAARSTNDPEGYFTIAHLRSGARSANPSQFVTGTAPMQQFANNAELARGSLVKAGATQQTDLAKLGTVLPKPGGYGPETALGVGGVGGFGYAALENPETLSMLNPLNHPILATGAALGYPAMRALYSETGRRLATSGLGQVGRLPPAIAPLGPLGGQVAPGLLTGLPDRRQTQP